MGNTWQLALCGRGIDMEFLVTEEVISLMEMKGTLQMLICIGVEKRLQSPYMPTEKLPEQGKNASSSIYSYSI
jgi:hypothetical protein